MRRRMLKPIGRSTFFVSLIGLGPFEVERCGTTSGNFWQRKVWIHCFKAEWTVQFWGKGKYELIVNFGSQWWQQSSPSGFVSLSLFLSLSLTHTHSLSLSFSILVCVSLSTSASHTQYIKLFRACVIIRKTPRRKCMTLPFRTICSFSFHTRTNPTSPPCAVTSSLMRLLDCLLLDSQTSQTLFRLFKISTATVVLPTSTT